MELQRGMRAFEAAGVWVAAVANDPVGAIAQFCDEHDITYPFLSDDGSTVIRQLGILNTLIEPDEALYGIPFPGAYLLDERGVVVQKYFHREYQRREAPAFVLADGFGLPPDLEGYPRAREDADGVSVEVVLGAVDLKPQQRVHLYVRAEPAAGWALAAAPAVEVDAGDDVATAGVAAGAPGEVRTELVSGARDVEAVPVDVTVALDLRDPEGRPVRRELRTRVELPVGDLNRARRDG